MIVGYGKQGLVQQRDNKIMNLFPLIHRSKKSQSFANPLNGLIFHSELQPIKKDAFSTISYSDSSPTPPLSTLRNHNVSSLKTRSNYKLRMERLEESPERVFRVAKSSRVLKPTDLFSTIRDGNETIKKERADSPSPSVFHFPQVEIIPLYLIENYQDISKYKMKANLQKYFQLYFSHGLKHNNPTLNQLIQKYIPFLKKQGMLDMEIDRKKWPKEFWEVKKVDQLITLMQKYERPSDYWIKYLLTLLQFYCVPHPTVRHTSLDNLLLLTRQHIKHVFQVQNPKEQCVFLLQDGTIVKDFIDIPFSATRLYLSIKKSTQQETKQAYFDLLVTIKNYGQQCKRKGFVGRLQRHFRKEITGNKYNEETINYDADYSSKEKERKISLYNAMMILERKKMNQNTHTKTITITPRPKSRQSLWKEEHVEGVQSRMVEAKKFSFHINLNNPQVQAEIKAEFDKYHTLSLKEDSSIGQEENFIYVLQAHHPVISALIKSPFHSLKVRSIFETIIGQKLSDDRQLSKATICWQNFIQLALLCSPKLKRLINMPDCMQLVRAFVENFLQMSQDDYYRDELTQKLYRMMEGDGSTLSMMEELVWSWLTQNGFVRLGAVQRERLWMYPERSKTFYLLIASAVMGTYSTTPMDLAFELMI